LVLDAVAEARANGVDRIEVTANAHALEFYEKLGFVEFGTATTQFGSSLRMRLTVAP
jgi:ribosomal protein S18 acetylase RimI-like enzyme